MSIAEKLREAAPKKALCDGVDHIALALTSEPARCDGNCRECVGKWYGKLADAIEAEQAVDVAALLKLADDLEETNRRTGRVCLQPIEAADRIREILKAAAGAKSTPLPEGIEWPRFESGELVKFGDEFTDRDGVTEKVVGVFFYEDKVFVNPSDRYSYGETVKRPEPEVLDADGVPINVGDTVYYAQPSAHIEGERIVDTIVGKEVHFTNGYWADPICLTHRKPDTQEAIDEDCGMEAYNYLKKRGICPPKSDYESQKAWKRDCRRLQRLDLLERQRKLLGGGQ